jgi:hypothetical protein
MSSSIGVGTIIADSSISASKINPVDGASGIYDYVITYDASAGTNKKVACKNILLPFYQRAVKTTADDTTTSSTVWSDVSSLAFTLPINKTFLLKYWLIAETATSTISTVTSLNLGATHTCISGAFFRTQNTDCTCISITGDQTVSAVVGAMPASNLANMIEMAAIIRSGGSSGQVVPSFRSETGSVTTVRIKTYSWGEVIQLD